MLTLPAEAPATVAPAAQKGAPCVLSYGETDRFFPFQVQWAVKGADDDHTTIPEKAKGSTPH